MSGLGAPFEARALGAGEFGGHEIDGALGFHDRRAFEGMQLSGDVLRLARLDLLIDFDDAVRATREPDIRWQFFHEEPLSEGLEHCASGVVRAV
jgi:hypothetical protein